jgi:hyperosmotically inducible periplasmic protein
MQLKSTIAAIVLLGTPIFVTEASAKDRQSTVREVRHELLMLSRYGVFDNISYRVEGNKVTLFGQVTQLVLKGDAEKAVRSIEGITRVDNQIEVLPLSPMDDDIRRSVFRAIYGENSLTRYSFQAVPPIHIIVKNGEVTLEGVVATEMDREVADIRAKGVSGVFSVVNHLRIEA